MTCKGKLRDNGFVRGSTIEEKRGNMRELQQNTSFIGGFRRLRSALDRLGEQIKNNHFRRVTLECDRCGEDPCVCGEAFFEIWNSDQLSKAEDEGRDH